MPLIDWIPSYNTGIAEIDIDNQQLVGIINLLHDSMTNKNNQEIVNDVIKRLAQNFQDHCTIANRVLAGIQYPELTQQQESHKKFGRILTTFLKRLKKEEKISAMELVGFLRNWFEKHVLIEDQRIKAFIKQKNNVSLVDELANSHIQPIEWKDSYRFNIDKIDTQHKNIVELYNKLYHSIEIKLSNTVILKILETLKNYSELHFKDEVLLMQKCQYTDYEHHAQLHARLIKDLENLIQKIKNKHAISYIKILEYLKDWILNHLLKEDKKIHDFILKQKEMSAQA